MGRELCIRVAAVQQQTNGTNCGLFAIANATSLLHGIDPETVTFNEYETREHLINCIEGKKLFPFPTANSIAERGCTSEVFSYARTEIQGGPGGPWPPQNISAVAAVNLYSLSF